MKLYAGVSLFDEKIVEPEALWDECSEVGCEGLVVGMRDAQTLASRIPDRVKFIDQQKTLRRLAEARPSELSLIPGPHDVAAMEFLSGIPMQEIWLPPVASHQPALVRSAARIGVPVIATVNGLGQRGFQALLQACEGTKPTLCYLAAQSKDISAVLMQLVWLRAQCYPVGLLAEDEGQLQAAAVLGADVLVISLARIRRPDWKESAIPLRLRRMTTRIDGPRPITREETDSFLESMPSLVATRRLEPGEKIEIADVEVRAVRCEQRGLAPFMLETIVGRRLRYGLDPGEPFSFGFLKEPEDND
jgi:hypothetical protein